MTLVPVYCATYNIVTYRYKKKENHKKNNLKTFLERRNWSVNVSFRPGGPLRAAFLSSAAQDSYSLVGVKTKQEASWEK